MRRAVLIPALVLVVVLVGAGVFVLKARTSAVVVVPATPTASPSASASATPVLGDAHSINFADPAIVGPIINHFGGGQVAKERVVYADVTGDHVDEAIAIVESGGTMGDLGAAVFDVENGKPHLLGYVSGTGKVAVTFGQNVSGVIDVKQGVYAPSDPLCCPTGLRETIYQWDGSKFAPISSQTNPNPPAPATPAG